VTIEAPLRVLKSLEQLYRTGFRDPVTDAALRKVAESQIHRDEIALRDLERDLADMEQQYNLSSSEFFRRWKAGEMPDTADFMDWNALYQMAQDVRQRLSLLRGRAASV
jgi:hypothetical protein